MSTSADRRFAYVERKRRRGYKSMTIFVPDTTHEGLKSIASRSGVSLQNYVAKVLTEHVRP